MAPKRKRKRKSKTKQRKSKTKQRQRRMVGGRAPFVIDFKNGFELLKDKDLWKMPSKAEEKTMKQRVAGYKREYRASGTKDSYNKWLVKKGYAKKADANCVLM